MDNGYDCSGNIPLMEINSRDVHNNTFIALSYCDNHRSSHRICFWSVVFFGSLSELEGKALRSVCDEQCHYF